MTQDATVQSLLTVIITTSPTPSAPSTELVSTILDSFDQYCPELTQCKVIVVFDGYDQIVPTARLKKGQVTPQQADDFIAYKKNVKELILRKYHLDSTNIAFTEENAIAEYGSPKHINEVHYTISEAIDQRVTFIESSRRLGFGLAVRSALRVTKTSHVWVQQHDWALTAHLPIQPLLQIMQAHESDPTAPIKYVCLAAVRMLSYATSAIVSEYPSLRDTSMSFTGEYEVPSRPGVKIPLTPMYFWHDKPHLASVAHYMERVFPTRLAMLRGDFIEDKIGQRARAQMKDGLWKKWATWLYYPDDGKTLCLRHLKGRTWEGTTRQADRAAMWRKKNEEGRIVETEGFDEVDDSHDAPLFLDEEEEHTS
ncbi:feruloyl esterase [Fusarium longipes]|uniref:Feruloyl esterase n=1 Tax=Fusarium longipes TaxID=694270 RepID=A0A395SY89_9HYPO|nr:feruloyl esterase [Fusarium longipes]